jgi:hypothetical protein
MIPSKRINETVAFFHARVSEHLYKILDKDIPWEDKEPYFIKVQEDKLVLEKLLRKTVEIKVEIIW